MPTFLKVIVEDLHGQWSAWFEDTPQIAMGGEWPSAAIEKLIDHLGADQFDVDQMVSVDDAARNGHLEFLIPRRHHRRIPVPSVN